MVTRQYDVCRNANRATRQRFPLLIVLQSDLLAPLETVVAAPVAPEPASAVAKLNPAIEILGKNYRVIMQEMAGVPRNSLGAVVGNAAKHHTALVGAIDLLFTGF